ncbi:hypothetical protein AZSI13_17100 [Azospira sp. I13]|nr:hypothetical protein AZSI13_17100 [Azospira sp. I13]
MWRLAPQNHLGRQKARAHAWSAAPSLGCQGDARKNGVPIASSGCSYRDACGNAGLACRQANGLSIYGFVTRSIRPFRRPGALSGQTGENAQIVADLAYIVPDQALLLFQGGQFGQAEEA